MKIFVSGVARRVDKFVAVITALSDYSVTEDTRFYNSDDCSEDDFIVSCVIVFDQELSFHSLDDSQIESICKLTGVNFLTSM